MFVLNSKIRIGGFSFIGVHEVKIKKTASNFQDTAIITTPNTLQYVKKGGMDVKKSYAINEFKTGDKVLIQLGYNGDLKPEFEGFVREVKLTRELQCEIICDNYSYQLRKNVFIKKHWNKTSVSEVLNDIVGNTDIKAIVKADMPLTGFRIDGNGITALLSLLKASGNFLTAFFIDPKTLWVGLKYTAFRSADITIDTYEKYLTQNLTAKDGVKFTNRRNCIKIEYSETLLDDVNVTIKVLCKKDDGSKVSQTISKGSNEKKVFLHQLKDEAWIKKIAKIEDRTQNNNSNKGTIIAFIQPYVLPADVVIIKNPRQPEKDGNYLVSSTEVTYGVNGARRVIEFEKKI